MCGSLSNLCIYTHANGPGTHAGTWQYLLFAVTLPSYVSLASRLRCTLDLVFSPGCPSLPRSKSTATVVLPCTRRHIPTCLHNTGDWRANGGENERERDRKRFYCTVQRKLRGQCNRENAQIIRAPQNRRRRQHREHSNEKHRLL